MKICLRELEADSLLARIEKSREYPHYSEEGLIRKLKRCHQRSYHLKPSPVSDPAYYLADQEWREIVRLARLTARQREVWYFRKTGWTFEEIGNWNGTTKQGALNVFRQASAKIRRAHATYPFVGLAEVYRDLTKNR